MDKNILILGASSDIGLKFIAENHMKYDNIVAHYNSNDEKLLELKNQADADIHLLQSNFSNNESVDDMIKSILELELPISHVLHLSAPHVKNTKFNKIAVQDYLDSYNIQVISVVKLLQKILPRMAKAKYGKVVFLLSSYTSNTPPKYLNDYVTNKHALLGLMKGLASEYADKQININAVSPSMMETKFLENLPTFVVEKSASDSPMKRNANIMDVTPMMQFLLSDDSSYITGQNIVISGGQ
jgi:3-oxoacyl-[acyl-carrier protein] reductase